jgi:hypothetical protein
MEFGISQAEAREVLGPWNAKHIPPGYFTGQLAAMKPGCYNPCHEHIG